MRPATRTTGAGIGLKERLAACRKKVICSLDTPASTLSVRRCWATSTTAIYAKGRTSASTASHPSIQLDPRVQLGFTALVGRPLGTTEPWLTRLQFDTIYIF